MNLRECLVVITTRFIVYSPLLSNQENDENNDSQEDNYFRSNLITSRTEENK